MKKSKKSEVPIVIEAPDYFKKDFGDHLTPCQKKQIAQVLKEFMGGIRILLDQSTAQLRRNECSKVGSPCATCAFNPATDTWKGFVGTVYGLVWALANDKLFMCHSTQPGWKENRLDLRRLGFCKGFALVWLVKKSSAEKLARRAQTNIRAIIFAS